MFGRPSSGARSLGWGGAALGLALVLGGCEQNLEVAANSGKPDIRNAIARGQLASPRAATVALMSLDGAPEAVQARFRQALTPEATSREISITDPASARYLLRGYFSAYPNDKGETLAYVFDLFDAAGKVRIQRISNEMDVPATSADPWGSVTDPVVQGLAASSADDLALALSSTPEARGPAVAAASPVYTGSPVVGATAN